MLDKPGISPNWSDKIFTIEKALSSKKSLPQYKLKGVDGWFFRTQLLVMKEPMPESILTYSDRHIFDRIIFDPERHLKTMKKTVLKLCRSTRIQKLQNKKQRETPRRSKRLQNIK